MIRFILLLAAAGLAQAAPAGAPDVAPERVATDDDKATEWPDGPPKKALTKSIGKLRKAASDEMVAQGFEELRAAGAGAAPGLLAALSKEKDGDAADRIREALDMVTAPAHTRLLAEEFDAKRDPVWRYAMLRTAELGDGGLRERAEEMWAALLEDEADPKRAKRIPEERREHLAVLALSTGSPAAVPACLELATGKAYQRWERHLTAAAGHARAAGAPVGDALAEALGEAKKLGDRLACLRLLTWAGNEAQAAAVAPCLDDTANNVKIAAINALRRMVDGDEPIARLSTFDAIERANAWKKRLGR